VRPEAADYLDKARSDLEDARKIAAIGLPKIAARTAYYAAFHAAEAFIVERAGKIAKTHSGLRAEFARLAKETSEIDTSFPKFLTKAYFVSASQKWRLARKIEMTLLPASRVPGVRAARRSRSRSADARLERTPNLAPSFSLTSNSRLLAAPARRRNPERVSAHLENVAFRPSPPAELDYTALALLHFRRMSCQPMTG